MAQEATVEIVKGKMIITLPLAKPFQKSASGKSVTIASTRGNFKSDVTFRGGKVTIGVNAYVPADDFETGKDKED